MQLDREGFRLDLLVNPYAPTDAASEALADIDLERTATEDLAHDLRTRLARVIGVDSRWITLANGIDELYDGIVKWQLSDGPFAVFPPTNLANLQRIVDRGGDIDVVARDAAFDTDLTTSRRRFSRNATSVVMSPNDPTGTLVDLHQLVRLSRQSRLTVVDERHAAYTPRSTAALAREFENVVVLQSMEWWAGLEATPIAWAVSPPSLGMGLRDAMDASEIDRSALVAARATLDDWSWMQNTLRRVTMEKGRLYRQLRKLSMLYTPYRSWANFVLVRFARGDVDFFVPRLEERGIVVHVPDQELLPNHMRVSAVSAEATDALKRGLIDIALELE